MIAQRLIRLAVRLLPAEERERWRDEWLAELAAERTSMGLRLRFALGICAGMGEMVGLLRRRAALHKTGPTPREQARSVKLTDANVKIRSC